MRDLTEKRNVKALFQVAITLSILVTLGGALHAAETGGATSAADNASSLVAQIVEQTGRSAGLVVLLDNGHTSLADAFSKRPGFLLQTLAATEARTLQLREHVRTQSSDSRATAMAYAPGGLPYADGIVSIFVAENFGPDQEIGVADLVRCLSPNAKAFLKVSQEDASWLKVVEGQARMALALRGKLFHSRHLARSRTAAHASCRTHCTEHGPCAIFRLTIGEGGVRGSQGRGSQDQTWKLENRVLPESPGYSSLANMHVSPKRLHRQSGSTKRNRRSVGQRVRRSVCFALSPTLHPTLRRHA